MPSASMGRGLTWVIEGGRGREGRRATVGRPTLGVARDSLLFPRAAARGPLPCELRALHLQVLRGVLVLVGIVLPSLVGPDRIPRGLIDRSLTSAPVPMVGDRPLVDVETLGFRTLVA